MYDLTVQGQSFFLIYKEQSQPVANFDIGARGQINDAQATKANVGWLTESDRLSQAFIFDSQGKSGIHVVTRKLASLMIGQDDVRRHPGLLSVCQLVFLFVVLLVIFARGRRWWRYAGRRLLPNQTLPFICFAKQL